MSKSNLRSFLELLLSYKRNHSREIILKIISFARTADQLLPDVRTRNIRRSFPNLTIRIIYTILHDCVARTLTRRTINEKRREDSSLSLSYLYSLMITKLPDPDVYSIEENDAQWTCDPLYPFWWILRGSHKSVIYFTKQRRRLTICET